MSLSDVITMLLNSAIKDISIECYVFKHNPCIYIIISNSLHKL